MQDEARRVSESQSKRCYSKSGIFCLKDDNILERKKPWNRKKDISILMKKRVIKLKRNLVLTRQQKR